jgi:hypothetical protein
MRLNNFRFFSQLSFNLKIFMFFFRYACNKDLLLFLRKLKFMGYKNIYVIFFFFNYEKKIVIYN